MLDTRSGCTPLNISEGHEDRSGNIRLPEIIHISLESPGFPGERWVQVIIRRIACHGCYGIIRVVRRVGIGIIQSNAETQRCCRQP